MGLLGFQSPLFLPIFKKFWFFKVKHWLIGLFGHAYWVIYHNFGFGGVPVLWSKWPLASSLLQAIKTCRQACPPGYLMHFSWGWIPESLVSNNSKLTKLLKVCWNHVLFILFRRSNFQQMLNNFVNFELLFTKLSGIHPYEKCIK